MQFAEVHLAIDKWVEEFPDVFDDGNQKLTKTESMEVTIDTEDHPPIYQRPYRLPLAKRNLVEREVQKMLDDEIIEPSSSPWSSPITQVPK